jgi:hypothetical protein
VADEARPGGPLDVESRRRIGHERIARRSLEARHDDVAAWIREVDVKASADRVVEWERNSQQTALTSRRDHCVQVEKRSRLEAAVLDRAHDAPLLGDVLNG